MAELQKSDLSINEESESELVKLKYQEELVTLEIEIAALTKLVGYLNAAYWVLIEIETLKDRSSIIDPKDYSFLTLRLFLKNLEASIDFIDFLKLSQYEMKKELKRRLIEGKVRSLNQVLNDDVIEVYEKKLETENSKLEGLKEKRLYFLNRYSATGSDCEVSRKLVDSSPVLIIIVGVLLLLLIQNALRDKNTKVEAIQLAEEFKEKILTTINW